MIIWLSFNFWSISSISLKVWVNHMWSFKPTNNILINIHIADISFTHDIFCSDLNWFIFINNNSIINNITNQTWPFNEHKKNTHNLKIKLWHSKTGNHLINSCYFRSSMGWNIHDKRKHSKVAMFCINLNIKHTFI